MDIWAIIGGIGIIIGIVAGMVQIAEYLQRRREKAAALDPQAVDVAAGESPAERQHLVQLRRTLTERFDEGELRTLCFDLGVDYEVLPGDDKADKARELVVFLERRERIPELIETGKQQRPDITEWAEVQLSLDMDQLRAKRDQADKARREMRERQRVVNLRPLDVTHTFKDRLREMRALCEHLADANVRLVSIVGRGGMGKTALASRMLADLEQGVLSVPGEERELAIDGILYLSGRSTGLGLERIYADVGRMLGQVAASRLAAIWASRDMPLAAKVEYLLEAMQDGLYLILLDNLEDELTEEGEVAEEGLRLFVERCLTMPGGARLIVTSREQVKIAHAALRNARSVPLREGLPEDEAVALLCELDPDGALGLKDASEETLRRAVRLTQGIPRALEILAGILREDPAASLARLLDDEDLFGEQVVERLVAQGYQRLGESERRVMEALAVFDRPVEETAVAYLLHPWFPGMDVRGSLRRLVGGYFVSASRVTGEYSLHPLDREYADRQLATGIETEIERGYDRRNLELRAADFYASMRKPESEWKSIEDLAPQLAEFEHRVRAGDYDGACQTLQPIDFDFLFLWGHHARLVKMRKRLQGQLADSHLIVDNLGRLGRSYYILGHYKTAIELYGEAIETAEKIDDDRAKGLRGIVISNMGNVFQVRGQINQAIEQHEEALKIACEVGDRRLEERCLGRLGIAYRDLGQVGRAVELYKEAEQIAREIGDRRYGNVWLGHLGVAYRDLGQVKRALKLHNESLNVSREIGDRRWEGIQIGNLGSDYYALGDFRKAVEHYKQALDVAWEIGARREESHHLGNLGRAYHRFGQVEQAIKSYQEALDITRQIGDRRGEEQHLDNLGRIHRILGQVRQAIKYHEQALEIARQIGDRIGEGQQLGRLGVAYRDLGQLDEAIESHNEALSIAREIGARGKEGRHLGDLGSVYRRLGRTERAVKLHTEAVVIAREIGNRRDEGMWLNSQGLDYRALGQFEQAIELHKHALDIACETGDQRREIDPLLSLGIVSLNQPSLAASDTFADIVTRCRALLDRTPNLFKPRYVLAAALVGQAVCDPRWKQENERTGILALAMAEYERALENCDAPGVVGDALRDLELIQAAGVEGLEPVFELLEGALPEA